MNMNASSLLISTCVAVCLLCPNRASAQTWTGDGADAKWTTGENWSDSIPANPGTQIVTFKSGSITPSDVDVAWTVGALVFENTSAMSLTGQELTLASTSLGYYLRATSSGDIAISNDLVLLVPDSSAGFTGSLSAGAGNMTLSGNVSIEKSGTAAPTAIAFQLRGTGSNNVINGNIQFAADTSANRWLTKRDSGTWTINGTDNNFSQVTLIDGTLKFASSTSLPSTSTIIFRTNGSGQTPTLDLAGQHHTVSSLTVDSPLPANTNGNNRIVSSSAGGQLSVLGAITVNDLGGGSTVVDADIDSATEVVVHSGGKLGGAGSISLAVDGDMTIEGVLSPGNITGTTTEAGVLTLGLSGNGKLIFGEGSSLELDLYADSESSDSIVFSSVGDWLSGSDNAELLINDRGINYGEVYAIMTSVTTADFLFASISGYDEVNYTASVERNGDAYELSFSAVPEPSQTALIAEAIGGLLCLSAKRRKKAGRK